MRNAAYNLLLEKYKKIGPNATKDVVVTIINAFGTNYRKVEEFRTSAIGTDNFYEPPTVVF